MAPKQVVNMHAPCMAPCSSVPKPSETVENCFKEGYAAVFLGGFTELHSLVNGKRSSCLLHGECRIYASKQHITMLLRVVLGVSRFHSLH